MDDRGGDRRTPVSSLMARYSYLPAGQTPLSPGTGFDPSLSNVPISMASSAGMTMPSFRPGQNVISDIAEAVVTQTDNAHSTGKTRNRQQDMDSYSCKDDSMHGLASRDSVGNMYGYSNYMNPPGNSFVPEGMGDRADLFMSQLGLTGRLPSSSLYSSLPQDSGNHRSGDSAALSPLHSAAERSILSRSVPPYLPLGTESNYVYFNPPALGSIGAAELSLSAGMHGSLGSFVTPSSTYSPSSAASRLRTCFPTMSASSAYNLSVDTQENNKQSSTTENTSKESYDMPWNLTHAPPEWNTSRKSNSRREMDMFEAQYKQSKSTSPDNESDMGSIIDHPLPNNFDGNKKNEMKNSSVKSESFAATSQNGSYYRGVNQNSSDRMFQENESSLMSTDFRNVPTHITNPKTMPAVGNTDQTVGEDGKYASHPQERGKKEMAKRPSGNVSHFHNTGSMTSQQMTLPVPAASSHSSSGQTGTTPFAVTPSVYSDSSENEQSIDQISSSACQKALSATSKSTETSVGIQNKFGPAKAAILWKKKQMQQSKGFSLSDNKAAMQAYQFDDQKQNPQSEEDFSPRWQTFTKVSDIDEEEEGMLSPPRIRLVIKKSLSSKLSGAKSYKTSTSGMGFTKGKGRIEKRTCGICQKTFSRADSLTCHMRVHTGDRPYQCQLCDANYKIAGQLRDHVRSKHSTSRPFVCAKCGKDFAYPTARRRHEKVCGLDLSERIEFQCPTCDKGFVTAKGFSKHLQTCCPNAIEHGLGKDKDSPFRCSACDKSFVTFPSLDRHQRFICGRIPQKGIYACEECGKMFHTRNRYITHTRRHVGEKPYKCSKCETAFFDKGTLKRHIERWHEEGGKFSCTPCGKSFYDIRSWKKHMIQQHDSQFVEPLHLPGRQGRRMKQHMCKLCGRSFIWRCLRAHVASEHPGMSLSEALSKDLLKCDICSKEFSSYQILRVHKRGHCSSQRFKCDKCNMQFAVKSVLGYHIQMHCQQSSNLSDSDNISVHMGIGSGDRPYQCQLCDASYKIAGHLRDHVRSRHSNSRPFLCAKCGKDFAYSTARRRHEKVCGVDLSERIQFQCSSCDKGFVTAKGYTKHQVTCSSGLGEDAAKVLPFKCTSCDKSFETFPTLDRHQRFICGRIPQKGIYACEECGKMFYKRDRYITHTRRHAGEKPYKCSQCELSFYDQGTLKTHMERWHEGSGKYKCTLCDKDFFYSRTWKKHMHQHSVELANSVTSVQHDNFQERLLKQYSCKLCSGSFTWKGLCAHVEALHPGVALSEVVTSNVNKEVMKCDVCSKEFSCPQSLSLHKRKHTGTTFKRYKCDKCNLQFAMKSSFLSHCRTHADGRPHRCEDCGKTFRWLHSLSNHRENQHGRVAEKKEKAIERYTCNECGKHFKQENFLDLHLKLKQHGSSQDTPCICSECGRGFSKMADYKTHMATHTNITNKPFPCSQCGASFHFKHLLDQHIKRTHSQEPLPSYLCADREKSPNQKELMPSQPATHDKYPSSTVSKPDHPQAPAKHCMAAEFAQGDTSNNNQGQTAEKEMESHLGLQNRSYMPSTSGHELRRDNYEGLQLPNDALPHFSTFENQNYPRHYSTFIHQTLAWPRPEGHCAEEG